jgi:chromosomal replication initiation ATPase DnaA
VNLNLLEPTLKILKEQVPASTFATWLKDTALLALTDRAAKILVPSSLAVSWLEKRLYWGIVRALRDVLHQEVEVQFVTAT